MEDKIYFWHFKVLRDYINCFENWQMSWTSLIAGMSSGPVYPFNCFIIKFIYDRT